jgi:hypothetical protein
MSSPQAGPDRVEDRNPRPDEGRERPGARPWPAWACWLVSGLLLFHLAAILACEVAGQVNSSSLENDVGQWFWWYVVLTHQEVAHSYFAPEPDPATPIVTARLQFAGGKPDQTIRLPDSSTRPRIRYLRQLALAWHLVHEWSQERGLPRPYWAASYARHLCRANPGCTRVELHMRFHRMPEPRSVVEAVTRGKSPELDASDLYTVPELIGVFSCDEL